MHTVIDELSNIICFKPFDCKREYEKKEGYGYCYLVDIGEIFKIGKTNCPKVRFQQLERVIKYTSWHIKRQEKVMYITEIHKDYGITEKKIIFYLMNNRKKFKNKEYFYK